MRDLGWVNCSRTEALRRLMGKEFDSRRVPLEQAYNCTENEKGQQEDQDGIEEQRNDAREITPVDK